MDIDIDLLKGLIAQREEIDAQIVAATTGKTKKPVNCSNCGGEGHTARSCKEPKKSPLPASMI